MCRLEGHILAISSVEFLKSTMALTQKDVVVAGSGIPGSWPHGIDDVGPRFDLLSCVEVGCGRRKRKEGEERGRGNMI